MEELQNDQQNDGGSWIKIENLETQEEYNKDPEDPLKIPEFVYSLKDIKLMPEFEILSFESSYQDNSEENIQAELPGSSEDIKIKSEIAMSPSEGSDCEENCHFELAGSPENIIIKPEVDWSGPVTSFGCDETLLETLECRKIKKTETITRTTNQSRPITRKQSQLLVIAKKRRKQSLEPSQLLNDYYDSGDTTRAETAKKRKKQMETYTGKIPERKFCNRCCCKFSTAQQFVSHLIKNEKPETRCKIREEWHCNFCPDVSDGRRFYLKHHMAKVHNGMLFDFVGNNAKEFKYKCNACNQYFHETQQFLNHMLRNHTNKAEKWNRCEFCDRRFTTVEKLTVHIMKHNNKNEETQPYRPQWEYRQKCQRCKRIFKTHKICLEHEQKCRNYRGKWKIARRPRKKAKQKIRKR